MSNLPPGSVCPWPALPRNEETGFFRGERPRAFSASRMAYPPGPGRPPGSKNRKPRKDLSGQVFGQLAVLERVEDHVTPSGKAHAKYRCVCDCGTEVLVLGHNLSGYKTTACGCQRGKGGTGPRRRRMPQALYEAVKKSKELGDLHSLSRMAGGGAALIAPVGQKPPKGWAGNAV